MKIEFTAKEVERIVLNHVKNTVHTCLYQGREMTAKERYGNIVVEIRDVPAVHEEEASE